MNKWTMKTIRVANRKTQKEVADKLGVSTIQLGRYENFKAVPSIVTALKFAEMFNENINNIIFFNNDVSKTKQGKEK